MLPLAVCSLVAVAIVLERFVWGPSRKRMFPEALQSDIRSLLAQGRFDELLGLCRAQTSPLARLTAIALENAGRPRREIVEVLESAGKREAIKLQRYVGTLGTIAAVGPLLGLLGTVFGIIATFGVIGNRGVGDPQALASGIAEALVATASGLMVAIPALAFHRFFLEQTRRLVVEMESFALEVLDRISASTPQFRTEPSAAEPAEGVKRVR